MLIALKVIDPQVGLPTEPRLLVHVHPAAKATPECLFGIRRGRNQAIKPVVSIEGEAIEVLVGVIVLDMGAQLAQVANQTRIFGLVPSARSRLNTVYMTTYFSGAAVGSALSTLAWVHWRWNGVSMLALLLVSLSAVRHGFGSRMPEPGVEGLGDGSAVDAVMEI